MGGSVASRTESGKACMVVIEFTAAHWSENALLEDSSSPLVHPT